MWTNELFIKLCHQNIADIGVQFFWDKDRQVATVVMETRPTQLVLSQFKNLLTYSVENWIRSIPAKRISKCCELVKLCRINLRPSQWSKCHWERKGTQFLHLQLSRSSVPTPLILYKRSGGACWGSKAAKFPHVWFLSASLYFSKRGAYWDRLCRDVVGRWLVGCHARALWPNGAS